MLPCKVRHYEAHLLKHAAGVRSRFAVYILHRGYRADAVHDLFGAVVHVDLDGLAAAGDFDESGRDTAFFYVALRRFDDHRGAVADERAGDRDDLPRLVGSEVEERRDPVRIGENLNDAAGGRDLHRRRHAERDLVYQPNLVDDRHLRLKAVVYQNPVVALRDSGADPASAATVVVERLRGVFKIDRRRDDRYIIIFRGALGNEFLYIYGDPLPHAEASRRRGVVSDHRRFRDDRFGDRLHRDIPYDGRRLVEAYHCQLLYGNTGLFQSAGQRMKDAVDVLAGTLNTGRRHCRAAEELRLSIRYLC